MKRVTIYFDLNKTRLNLESSNPNPTYTQYRVSSSTSILATECILVSQADNRPHNELRD
uniref:AlNc14C20G2110 protein n=1 Tax=Albugo laibachii Nc14 TaxID=890382 RepID=F0W5E4_9STRA|nr:AlNc14C20G2110 [Albugo laibachii Nc14]|eukprot:CCA16335.1 AlNc14C20G2110 [Albugo laibachii Nc14]